MIDCVQLPDPVTKFWFFGFLLKCNVCVAIAALKRFPCLFYKNAKGMQLILGMVMCMDLGQETECSQCGTVKENGSS